MKQKNTQRRQGFTLVELLIVISIIALLAGLAFPSMTAALTRAHLLQAVSNGSEIYKATLQASTDAATNGTFTVTWPGDMTNPPADMVAFATALNAGGYLPSYKILAADNVAPAGATLTAKNIAFSFGMVTSNTADTIPFLTTKNFNPSNIKAPEPTANADGQTSTDGTTPATSTDAGTPATPPAASTTDQSTDGTQTAQSDQLTGPLDVGAKPFGKKGFAVIRKGGDATSSINPNDIFAPQGPAGSYMWGQDPAHATPPVKWIQTPQE